MELRTSLNGGNASIQEVAAAWEKTEHHFHWSKSEHDHWAVEYAQRLHDAERKAGPARPDPRNIHHD